MTQKTLIENSFGSITQVALSPSHEKLVIAGEHATGEICLYGGHVLHWQPNGEREVFWLSDDATYTSGTAIRGGIPLCWPWFGPHQKGDVKGNHGFARNSIWQLASAELTEQGAIIEITLQGENQHALWPESFTLKQSIFIGKTFSQRLAITNHANHAVEYSCAIHSYFSVSNPENCQVPVLERSAFDDKITQCSEQPQALPNCVGPLDRIYYNEQVAELIDNEWQRKIVVTPVDTKQWVLWNPGTEVADNMADVHSGGEQEYVCLEAANTIWRSIEAGETAVIGQDINVKPL